MFSFRGFLIGALASRLPTVTVHSAELDGIVANAKKLVQEIGDVPAIQTEEWQSMAPSAMLSFYRLAIDIKAAVTEVLEVCAGDGNITAAAQPLKSSHTLKNEWSVKTAAESLHGAEKNAHVNAFIEYLKEIFTENDETIASKSEAVVMEFLKDIALKRASLLKVAGGLSDGSSWKAKL